MKIIDIAIIGGGVAGAYTAYRLKKVDPGASSILQNILKRTGERDLGIALFECSDRIGGRLWSYRFPNLSGQVAELGGMCFKKLQQNVYGLCTQELKLDISACACYSVSHFRYLRGRRFQARQFVTQPETIPYFLSENEKGQAPFMLIKQYLEEQIPDAKQLIGAIETDLKQGDLPVALQRIHDFISFLREARIASTNMPIYEYGFWNFLAKTLSSEAYQLATVSGSLTSDYRNGNLYDAFLLFYNLYFAALLPGASARLSQGFDQLPRVLIEQFIDLGGIVHLQRQLNSLQIKTHEGERLIALSLSSPDGTIQYRFYARNVVLALPQQALKLLDGDNVLFQSPQFKADINAVTPVAASKLFFTYNRPWWENLPYGPDQLLATKITNGHSLTDLPLRACYYVGTEKDGMALLLASLNDDVYTHFWRSFRPEARFGSDHGPFLADHHSQSYQSLLAPTDMVTEAQRQLKEMHGFQDIPEPMDAIYIDWTENPYGGGWHVWNPHLKSWDVISRIRRPAPDLNIFICGDTFSAHQGWVEGALNSAEMVLETYFALPRPSWVLPQYDFGP